MHEQIICWHSSVCQILRGWNINEVFYIPRRKHIRQAAAVAAAAVTMVKWRNNCWAVCMQRVEVVLLVSTRYLIVWCSKLSEIDNTSLENQSWTFSRLLSEERCWISIFFKIRIEYTVGCVCVCACERVNGWLFIYINVQRTAVFKLS